MTRSYWRLWRAAAVNNVGDGAFAAAVPLLAVSVTRDPRLVSVVSAATYLPWLLFSLPAGALVDRHDRVGLMWRSQAAQAVVVGGVAILTVAGAAGVPAVAAAAFLLGACEVVFTSAAQAVLPDLVPKPLLHKANGNLQSVTTIGEQFAGPPLGSLLFAARAALPFVLDAVTFAMSSGLLARLPRKPGAHTERLPMRAAIATGLRWLTGHRLLRTLAA